MKLPGLIGCMILLLPVAAEANMTRDPLSDIEELIWRDLRKNPREGVATYYSSRFIGRRTSSGERYHPEKLTAAHAKLPMGTLVRVRSLNNEQEVVVRINDRCHQRHAPRNLIDLSRAASRQLGLLGKGMTKVTIVPLHGESEATERLLMELIE